MTVAAVVRRHQRVLLPVLMQTAAASLQALAADPHYLGGTLGMLAVLHTWTHTLVHHPHVHCLVPDGALAPDGGRWRRARGQYLVPVRALPCGFRACYVHRAVITDARIVRVDAATVTFRYQDARARARAWRTMTLPGEEFLRRILQHVLPRGSHKVRYYGWWRPQAAATRTRVQQQLAPPVPTPRLDGPPPDPTVPQAPCCLRCGAGHLLPMRRLLRGPALARPP